MTYHSHPVADFMDWMEAHHPELFSPIYGLWVPVDDSALFKPEVEAAIGEYDRWCENEDRAMAENLRLAI